MVAQYPERDDDVGRVAARLNDDRRQKPKTAGDVHARVMTANLTRHFDGGGGGDCVPSDKLPNLPKIESPESYSPRTPKA